MEKISLTDCVINEEVLHRVKDEISYLQQKERRLI